MASLFRPNVLQQTYAAASRRAFSTQLASVTKSAPSIAARPAIRNAFAKDVTPSQMRVAAFHASGRNAILPPLPQSIDGTANDAAKFPPTSPTHGSYHWTFERLIAVSLVPLTVAPFAAGSLNPLTDAVLCAAVLVHSHIGFQALIIDYLPNKRIPKTRKLFDWGLNLATVLVGVGLYEFETNDVGLTEAIKKVWTA